MELYHGSNVLVKEPKIITSNRRLDFESGFYTTSSYEQALRWARLKQQRSSQGEAIVNVYEIDENSLNQLNVRTFAKANAQWLKYISENRQGKFMKENSDIIIGPVANDQTMPTITLYMLNELSVQETIKRLKTQNLKDQYTFKTDRALKILKFKEFRK